MQDSGSTPDRPAPAADPRRIALNALSELTVEEFGQVLGRIVRDDNTVPLVQELVAAATAALSGISELAPRMHNGQAHLLVQQLGELLAAGHAGVIAVTAEALDRGEIAASQKGSTTAWVRDHCRYLRSGGAGITSKAAGLLRRPELRRLATRIRNTELHPTIAVAIGAEYDKLVGSLDERYLERMGLPATPMEDESAETDGTGSAGDPSETPSGGEECGADSDDRTGWTVGDVVLEKFCRIGKSGGTRDVKNLRDHLLAQYGAAGAFQDDADAKRKYVELSAGRLVSGIWRYDLALDPEGRAELEAAINVLAKPFPQNSESGEIDLRSQPQRRGQALVEVFRRATAAPRDIPPNPKSVLHVMIGLDDLINRTGSGTVIGTVAAGTPLPVDTLRKLACAGGIIPTVMGSDGEVLDLGRPVRYFTRAQARALWVRDQHCTFPGCDVPATWCDNHHLVHVADGGGTDLVNGALLCGRHHTIVHRDLLYGVVVDGKVVWDLRPNSYLQALLPATVADSGAPHQSGGTDCCDDGADAGGRRGTGISSDESSVRPDDSDNRGGGVGVGTNSDGSSARGGSSENCGAGGGVGTRSDESSARGGSGENRSDKDGDGDSVGVTDQPPERDPVIAPQRASESRPPGRTSQSRTANDPRPPPQTGPGRRPPERPGRSPISRT